MVTPFDDGEVTLDPLKMGRRLHYKPLRIPETVDLAAITRITWASLEFFPGHIESDSEVGLQKLARLTLFW